MTECVCRSGLEYETCCKPILEGKPAPTAEALMRARFTAFVSKDVAFLERSLGQALKADFDRHAVSEAMSDAQGLGVEILAKEGGEEGDAEGMVEYVARFKVGGKPLAHHERARFVREEGAWVYAEGEVNPKTAPVHVDKVGRNDPCPCGSGKKYKKCCGA